jgi:hypothetical protein
MIGEHNVSHASDFHLIMPGVFCYKNNLAKIHFPERVFVRHLKRLWQHAAIGRSR